jgi:putative transposase
VPYRLTPFQTDCYYHIFNRGVEKRQIFSSDNDYQRFLGTVYYYLFSGPKPRFSTFRKFKFKEFYLKPKIVEVICYCLMPNHFHMLVKQVTEGGIHEFISKLLNSFTKYYNTKHNRIGPLFQGQFKAVLVETDEQLVHLSRYIHLNPLVSNLVTKLDDFKYSSYPDFVGLRKGSFCFTQPVLSFFKEANSYKNFVKDYEGYGKDIHRIKQLLLEEI